MTAMTLISRLVIVGGLVCAAMFFSGCATTDVDTVFTHAPDATTLARLNIGDSVTVTLSGLPDPIDPHADTIKEDGTITMPDVGDVQAAGKTPGELQKAIHDLYVPKIYTHVTVAVTIGDRVYYVDGEVKQPQRLLYVGETTVTKGIAAAGGFSEFADRSEVWLVRGKHRLKVNYNDVFNDPSKDPLVYPGDEIVVSRKLY
jgi:polysaccharide export outer membrane protein